MIAFLSSKMRASQTMEAFRGTLRNCVMKQKWQSISPVLILLTNSHTASDVRDATPQCVCVCVCVSEAKKQFFERMGEG